MVNMVKAADLDCRNLNNHHSDDRVDVYGGRPMPARVCGFHASRMGSEPRVSRSIWAAQSTRVVTRPRG